MSYVSGFMMGAAIGKNIHKAFFGKRQAKHRAGSCLKRGATPDWALKSMLPGRRRYYAVAFIGNAALAEHVAVTMEEIPFIRKVTVSTITGSLLVEYTGEEEEIDRVMQEIKTRLMTIRQEERGRGGSLAKVGVSIRRTVLSMNDCLRRATAGWLDFSSLLSLVFIVRGLRKVIDLGQRPSGPQMLWWAVSLLRGWRLV
ncbi:hypothetical protein TAMA11512_04880 [Selenomonas sp. TAMA-11512]|uniref:HMA2 domain-containing protein n=1 Tax=Selenomonas sp. TAMA-11512 TaxID=3095337 RepID=UPI00308D9F58|nr:hypothetical protein TAMA11512_04880 [Selenomonas sp. TAMA-11512]